MLKAGIVGLPNVGKSTLFNAVTRTRKAEAANYPFCTIDPNLHPVTGAIGPVRDIETVTSELVLADLESVTKRLDRVSKDAKRGDKAAVAEELLLKKIEPHLNAGKPAITLQLTTEEKSLA